MLCSQGLTPEQASVRQHNALPLCFFGRFTEQSDADRLRMRIGSRLTLPNDRSAMPTLT